MRERKTGNFYALKCVKKKQLHHSNLENEIKVLKRYEKTMRHNHHRVISPTLQSTKTSSPDSTYRPPTPKTTDTTLQTIAAGTHLIRVVLGAGLDALFIICNTTV